MIRILIFLFCFNAFGQKVVNAYVTFPAATCAADPNEIHTASNAASDPNCTEANATTGFSQTGTTFTSVTTDPQVGDYHFRVLAGDGSSDRIEYAFSITSGNTYTISFKAYQTVGNQGRASAWVNLTGSPSGYAFDTTGWRDESWNVTASATGTATVRLYVAQTGGAANDELYIDNFSVIDTTP